MLQSSKFTIERYITAEGISVLSRWLASLKDRNAYVRIIGRLSRLEQGNFGDCKPVGGGVWELRINYGPGYRVYYSLAGKTIILLLCGGDKRSQDRDIACVIDYWKEYKRRQ